MDTKSKNWTARRAVKILSAIMSVVFLSAAALGVLGLAKLEDADAELLFSNPDNNNVFFENFIPEAEQWMNIIFWLRDEDNIRSMGNMTWSPVVNTEYDDDGIGRNVIVGYNLISKDRTYSWSFGYIPAAEIDGPDAKQIVNNAIYEQIKELIAVKAQIEKSYGLTYRVINGGWRFENVARDAGADYFRDAPVYLIEEYGKEPEASYTGSRGDMYNRYFSNDNLHYNLSANEISEDNTISLYISYSKDAVMKQKSAEVETKRVMIWLILTITMSAAFFLVSLAVFLAGAGRRYNVSKDEGENADKNGGVCGDCEGAPDGNARNGNSPGDGAFSGGSANINAGVGTDKNYRKIWFLGIDKPWLDVSLIMLLFYGLSVSYIFCKAISIAWRQNNDVWLNVLCCSYMALAAAPSLWWLSSFAKYCKANKAARHTLIYTFTRWLAAALRRTSRSLWAGLPLTIRSIAAGLALFILMCIPAAAMNSPPGPGMAIAFIVSAAATFALLRQYKRLHTVERGAYAAVCGDNDSRIDVTGGELGSIAASINNISEGINAAVAERIKSERMKTELITNVSHDIRTPITSLITYADLLKNEGFGSERAVEYLDVIIQKSARLKALTDDLFEASKAASGNLDVCVSALDFTELVRQVLGELDAKMNESGLDFRISVPERAPVFADGKLLQRVVENLMSNVIKYALRSSRVYVEITREHERLAGSVNAEQPGECYRLDIKNISERELNIDPSELTERFTRADAARGGDGSGLGLSIAQSLAELMNGRLSLAIDGDLFKASVFLPAAVPNQNGDALGAAL